LFAVTSVSSTTANVGLSEIQCYGLASSCASSSVVAKRAADPSEATISSTANGINPINWARYASASAKSSASQQTAQKAVDGLIGGYTASGGDFSREWASGTTVGASMSLKWSTPVSLSSIVLYDRPNPSDWCTGGTIAFSDGGVITFPSLANDGSATPLNFASILTTSLTWTCTSVGPSSGSIGLSELQAFSQSYVF
jgi:hypothetical protein